MFDNVPFFDYIHSKFAKSANIISKTFIPRNQYGVLKKAEVMLIPNYLKWA
jgi:hypothetical protein